MTKRIIVTLVIEAIVLACLLTLALDMRAHNRVERLGGVNIWGYRGPVMQQKASNEIRIATIGGDLAFGWGVAASETLVYGIRQFVALALDVRGSQLRRSTSAPSPSSLPGTLLGFATLPTCART